MKTQVYVKRKQLSDDELMHWKYIKKVKTKNGKWRYIYDLDELKEDAEEFVDGVEDTIYDFVDNVERKTGIEARRKMKREKREFLIRANNAQDYGSERKNVKMAMKNLEGRYKEYDNLKSVYGTDVAEAYKTYQMNYVSDQYDKYIHSKAEYQKTLVGTPSRIIDAGKEFVDYLINPRPTR